MKGQRFGDLGFTRGEQKVYVALLKLGPTTTGRLAGEAGVSRSKLYEILDKLARKGLASHVKRNRVSVFSPAHPTRILDYLKEREETLREQRASFEKTLPAFVRLVGQAPQHGSVEFFEGSEGIRSLRETLLKRTKPGDTLYFLGKNASGQRNMRGYWDDLNTRRIRKRVWAHDLYNWDATDWAEQRKRLPYTKVRYLPRTGPTPAWFGVWGDTVVITTRQDREMNIAIHDKSVAESVRTLFGMLWERAPENI